MTNQIRLKVTGMTCGHCEMRVKKSLDSLSGVKKADVILKDNSAEVMYDSSKITPKELIKAVEDAGYQATL